MLYIRNKGYWLLNLALNHTQRNIILRFLAKWFLLYLLPAPFDCSLCPLLLPSFFDCSLCPLPLPATFAFVYSLLYSKFLSWIPIINPYPESLSWIRILIHNYCDASSSIPVRIYFLYLISNTKQNNFFSFRLYFFQLQNKWFVLECEN